MRTAVIAVIIAAAASAGPVAAAYTAPSVDRDCADFPTQEDAQAFFLANDPDADPHRLDRDGDRVACEANAHEQPPVQVAPPVPPVSRPNLRPQYVPPRHIVDPK